MDNTTYQNRELDQHYRRMDDKKASYFETLAAFDSNVDDYNYNLEQLEWIENGSYGVGPCLALQKVENSLNGRTNNVARIGQFFLSVMYGCRFQQWNKLSKVSQAAVTKAVKKWLSQKHEYAMKLEV
jgi:hypothetical protein|tara:strand:- start:673 stop:1053 length:381 start_codon:yes stop_codon:yes gene_type:complete